MAMNLSALGHALKGGAFRGADFRASGAVQRLLRECEGRDGDAPSGLTLHEQEVLREAGLTPERRARADVSDDPQVKAALEYAEIVSRSLSRKQAGEMSGLTQSRVDRMIADRSIYSFLGANKRLIPAFQFDGGCLIPNIARVNQVLSPGLHPITVRRWYHLPHSDLFINDDIEQILSPLDWLRTGQDAERVAILAECL